MIVVKYNQWEYFCLVHHFVLFCKIKKDLKKPAPLFKEPKWTQGGGEKKREKRFGGKNTREPWQRASVSALHWPDLDSPDSSSSHLHTHSYAGRHCSYDPFHCGFFFFFFCSSYSTWSLLQLLRHRQLQGQPMTKNPHYSQWQSSQTKNMHISSYYTRASQFINQQEINYYFDD